MYKNSVKVLVKETDNKRSMNKPLKTLSELIAGIEQPPAPLERPTISWPQYRQALIELLK